MPELLLEFLSEEIPARMQQRAVADLQRLVNERLLAAGFMPEGVKAFATPRRLSLVATGLPGRQPDRKEEKKGPRVGAPEQAVAGFLKSAGLSSLDQCEIREDKKGQFYVAVVDEKGRTTAEVIADFVPAIVKDFPWPKSMRWGDGDLRWVRPLHSVLCSFDHEVVPVSVDGVAAGDRTSGHRFMAPKEIRARDFAKYESALRSAKVILDTAARKELIAGEAKTLCEAQGLELVEDQGLLNEVAGLAEWPVPQIGSFDEKFLALPDEVLTATMRGHQKYFSVRNPKTGRLANKFVYVANIESPDGGKAMRAGYERVLTARLSDAWYLYHQDLKRPLKDRIRDLDRVTFFEGLGTVGDKARRVAALAKEIAPAVGADPQLAEEAALLAKADLVTGMVYEFPELQGVMGRYYFLAQALRDAPDGAPQGEGKKALHLEGGAKKRALHPEEGAQAPVSKDEARAQAIANAIREHYKPAGQDDEVPTAPVSVAVALADKIDTLTAFWAIGKKPTGSSDPFALRRAALGVIRCILQRQVRIELFRIFHRAGECHLDDFTEEQLNRTLTDARKVFEMGFNKPDYDARLAAMQAKSGEASKFIGALVAMEVDLLMFLHDRLKVYLRDNGHRHDLIESVLDKAPLRSEDDLVLIVRKLEALEAFLKSDDGANLAAGYKRAANILKAEEKKDADVGRALARHEDAPHTPARRAEARPTVDEKLLQLAEEKALFTALKSAEEKAAKAVAAEKFGEAMAALASLRKPIDAFFDKVTVNAEEKALRANRLALLARFRAATAAVADLSKLEG